MIERLYRRTLLGLASSGGVRAAAERLGPRLGVHRFVAGTSLEEALPAVRTLQGDGLLVILDLLGEYVDDPAAAAATTEQIDEALSRLGSVPEPPGLSVKPTQLGLAIDDDLAYEHASALLDRAREVGTTICLDMENSPYVERTLALFERLRDAGHSNVATVLQSYLYRTPDDLERLLRFAPDLELRIVKGAYRETSDVAHQDKERVDAAFRDLVYLGLEGGARIDVASHDERLLREVAAYVRGAGLGPERYEFQLLFGVRTQLQRDLAREHPVRIYVPFGRDWYGYFSRRLAERPANLAFVLRGLVG